jgi:hypothetical protein
VVAHEQNRAVRADVREPADLGTEVQNEVPIPKRRRDDRMMRLLLIVFGLVQIVLGLLLWITPGFFYDEIGPFGARNDHYMADVATFYLALGAAALVSVRRASWRVPVLALALVQYALHALNHLLDIGESDPGWIRPADFVSLTLTTMLLAWMLSQETATG